MSSASLQPPLTENEWPELSREMMLQDLSRMMQHCVSSENAFDVQGSPFRLDDQASARRELERLRDVRDRCRSHRQELHDQRTRLLGALNAAKTVQACVLHAAADAVGDDRDGSRAASLSMDDVVRYFASWLPPDESAALLASASDPEQQQSSRASSSHSGHAPMVAQRTRGSGSSSTARSRTMGAIDEDSTAAESHSSAPPSPPSSSTRRTLNGGGGGGLTMLSFAAQRALASPSAYLSSSASSTASSVCASPFAMPSTPRALPASLLRSALGAVELHAMPDAVLSPPPPPRAFRASPPHPPPRALGADIVPVAVATVQSAPVVSQSFAMEAAPTQPHKSRSEVANDSVSAAPVTNALLDSVTRAPVAEQEEEPNVDVSVVHAPPRANSPLPLSVVEVDSPTAHHAPSSPDENVTANAGTQIHHEEEDANHSAAAVALTALDAAAEAALDGAALELDDLDLL